MRTIGWGDCPRYVADMDVLHLESRGMPSPTLIVATRAANRPPPPTTLPPPRTRLPLDRPSTPPRPMTGPRSGNKAEQIVRVALISSIFLAVSAFRRSGAGARALPCTGVAPPWTACHCMKACLQADERGPRGSGAVSRYDRSRSMREPGRTSPTLTCSRRPRPPPVGLECFPAIAGRSMSRQRLGAHISCMSPWASPSHPAGVPSQPSYRKTKAARGTWRRIHVSPMPAG